MSDSAETTVPILEIAPGWPVEDVATLEDCDDAHAVLSERIAVLEVYVQEAHAFWLETKERDPEHGRKSLELRMKKAVLQALNNTRGRLVREERRKAQQTADAKFIEFFRMTDPESYARICALARAAGVNQK